MIYFFSSSQKIKNASIPLVASSIIIKKTKAKRGWGGGSMGVGVGGLDSRDVISIRL